ncbi:hypothetical protein [Azotosporobacter soli]|uniref:hypothetical protein n=1 Tax=Azotosporobacter soli TaxID=3055040 RepID=UPI0031FF381B
MSNVNSFFNQYQDLLTAQAKAFKTAIDEHGIESLSNPDSFFKISATNPGMVKVNQEAASQGFSTNAFGWMTSASFIVGAQTLTPLILEKEGKETRGSWTSTTLGLSAGAATGPMWGFFNHDPKWLIIDDGGTHVNTYGDGFALVAGIEQLFFTRSADDSFLGWMIGPVAGLNSNIFKAGISGKISS